MKLIIVSGTSGAGKSIALQALEDLGFYCIDNLPIGMLPVFATQIVSPSQRGYDDAAVGIDARNLKGDFSQFQNMLDGIRRAGLACEIFFLDADTSTLLKRYSETRRRHPLTNSNVPLYEAIKAERGLLKPMAECADWHIDTSRTTIHQLREIIRERVKDKISQSLSLLFLSFGYKHGLPSDADFVFDLRCLPNPHWDPFLRPKTGRDDEVVEFLQSQSSVEKMLGGIVGFLNDWVPYFEAENRSYLTVAVGCTGGQHRSVYMVEALAARLRPTYPNVLVRHRELS